MKTTPVHRTIIGAFTGLISGSAIIFGAEALPHMMYPPPASIRALEGETYEQQMERIGPILAEHIQSLPPAAFIGILVAYLLGTIGGGAVAGKIARGNPQAVYVTGGLLLMGASMNLINIPHPMWFNVAVPVVYIVGIAASLRLIRTED
jgi:hypothetical protein